MFVFGAKKRVGSKIWSISVTALVLCLVAGLSVASSLVTATASSTATFAAPNDKDFDKQWVFNPFEDPYSGQFYPYTSIDKAWQLVPSSAQKIRVAILDNGFDIDHPDLVGNVNKSLAWNTFYENNDVSLTAGSGHGTHVAGILGAVANNGIGIAGIANNYAELVLVKTIHVGSSDAQTGVTLTETAKGIDYAVAQGCKVINISNGTYYSAGSRHAELDRAIANAINKGVVIVAAAGNKNSTDQMFPSDHDRVISVTSATKTGNKASYSDHNQAKNIAAPGGSGASYAKADDIYSTVPGGGYDYKNGTSMAAPFVTGVVALMFAANPNLTVVEVIDALQTTATDLGAKGRDDDFGDGLVNAEKAVQKALDLNSKGGNPTPTPSPTQTPIPTLTPTPTMTPTPTSSPTPTPTSTPTPTPTPTLTMTPTPTSSSTPTPSLTPTPSTTPTPTPTPTSTQTPTPSPTPTKPGINGNNDGNGANDGNNSTPGNAKNNANGNNNCSITGINGGNNSSTSKKYARYKVTFMLNGGKKLQSTCMKKIVTKGKKYGKLLKPKREKHTFLGWYTKKKGGNKITAKSVVQIKKNHKLYAHWRVK